MCSQTDDEPGPPLKQNVTGRVAGSATFSSVYATKKTRALGLPLSGSSSSSFLSSDFGFASLGSVVSRSVK